MSGDWPTKPRGCAESLAKRQENESEITPKTPTHHMGLVRYFQTPNEPSDETISPLIT
jgi:hypothetical protein